ncbi:MAG: helix-turn-helix transcriptional regulator [Desulfosporosinus sp.]|nr:helix-turn-helix transcriptional regulator [Desulfosporosinus sp.]
MGIGDRLKKIRNRKGLNQKEAAESFGISNVVLNRYENDERTPDVETLGKLAEFYGVTTDYLLGRTDKTTHSTSLSPKEERDLGKDLNRILSDLESDEALAFDGEPLDEETKALMKVSLENSMRLAKQIAKNKFTPKKYK